MCVNWYSMTLVQNILYYLNQQHHFTEVVQQAAALITEMLWQRVLEYDLCYSALVIFTQ